MSNLHYKRPTYFSPNLYFVLKGGIPAGIPGGRLTFELQDFVDISLKNR